MSIEQDVNNIVSDLENSQKPGPKPTSTIEILTKLKGELVPSSELSDDPRALAARIGTINNRTLKPEGLKIVGEVHYKIIKIQSEES